jgi:hypothetical protein
VQDEVADYNNNNNNKCSDLTLQTQNMMIICETYTAETVLCKGITKVRTTGPSETIQLGRWANLAGRMQDEAVELQYKWRGRFKLERTGRWAEIAEWVRDEAEVVFDGTPVPKNGSPGAMFATAVLLREFLTPARSSYVVCRSALLHIAIGNSDSYEETGRSKMARIGRWTKSADEAEEVAEDMGQEE